MLRHGQRQRRRGVRDVTRGQFDRRRGRLRRLLLTQAERAERASRSRRRRRRRRRHRGGGGCFSPHGGRRRHARPRRRRAAVLCQRTPGGVERREGGQPAVGWAAGRSAGWWSFSRRREFSELLRGAPAVSSEALRAGRASPHGALVVVVVFATPTSRRTLPPPRILAAAAAVDTNLSPTGSLPRRRDRRPHLRHRRYHCRGGLRAPRRR